MIISIEQVADILQDIFICGWNDKSLKNEYRQYNNALVQLVYNYGRISSTDSLITTVEQKYQVQIQEFITLHFSTLDLTQIFN